MTGPIILDNGKIVKDMVQENKFEKMVLYMKEPGQKIGLMAMED